MLDEQVFTSESYVRHFLPKDDKDSMDAGDDMGESKFGAAGGFMPGMVG